MATYYALPGLTAWNGTGSTSGWSTSSGGLSITAQPTSADDVVFDSNSGPARTITLTNNAQCRTITAIDSNAITLSGAMNIQSNAHLTSLAGVGGPGTAITLVGSGGAANFNPGNCVVNGPIIVNGSYTLFSNLVCTDKLTLNAAGTVLNCGSYNLTLGKLNANSGILNMGSGSWVITGTGNDCFSFGASVSVNANTAAVRFTGSGSITIDTYGLTMPTLNFTGNQSVALNNSQTAVINLNGLIVGPAVTLSVQYSRTVNSSNYLIDGTASRSTIQTNSQGNRATLSYTGSGQINMDWVSLRDISFTPAGTWRARNSIDGGNNLNVTFVPGNSSFANFF